MFHHTQAPRPNFAFVESNSTPNLWALSSISIIHTHMRRAPFLPSSTTFWSRASFQAFHFPSTLFWGKISAPLSLSLSLSLHCLIILKLNFNPILITWCLSRTFQLFHNPTGDIHANHVIMTWMPKKLHFSLSIWSQRDWTNKRYVSLVKCT